MPQVDPVSTPASIPAQAEALVAAWQIAIGRDPPLSLVELNLAQLALENGNGKALWNNNPGNLTTGSDSVDYYILSQLVTDNIGRRIAQDDPSRVILHFHAFPDLPTGMLAYVHFLQSRPSLIQAGTAGDAVQYAKAIKSSGYTPGIDTGAVAVSLQSEIASFRSGKVFDRFALAGSGADVRPPAFRKAHPLAGALTLLGGAVLAWRFRHVRR